MNRKSKYYFLISKFILFFILMLVVSALLRISSIYQNVEPNVFATIRVILQVFNVLLIIMICLIGIYLAYQIFSYTSSAFYRDYKVNMFEAVYHGILDIYLLYDKINIQADDKSIKIDFTNNIITFSRRNKFYSIIFADLFDRIDGRIDSDYWFSMRKPKKAYGKVTYTKKIRFPNPIIINQKYTEKLKEETGKDYQDFVVLTGFYKMESKYENVVSPYEIVSLID